MIIAKTIHELRNAIQAKKSQGQSIGLVPTMGNLHEGHLSLATHAKRQTECVVTTIFVNETQFGANEDFDKYPRTEARDQKLLETVGNDILFLPKSDELYPNGIPAHTDISMPMLGHILCGASRPHHFAGVALIICKLFNCIQPDIAFFGEKDFQQLLVIKQLTQELLYPIEIQGVPIMREQDGLAMSSRNQYLNQEQRSLACQLFKTLQEGALQLKSGKLLLNREEFEAFTSQQQKILKEKGFTPDYFAIRNPNDLSIPKPTDKKLVLLIAAKLGSTRLIDNLSVDI